MCTYRYGYLARMRGRRIDAMAAAVLVVCWSSGFVGAVLGTRAAPVDTVLAWRSLVSALVLGSWALLRGLRVPLRALLRQGGLGLLVQVLYLGGVFAAAGAGVPAGTSALIAALQPMVVAAVAGPLLGERTSRRQRTGLLVATAGVALVVAVDLGGGQAAAWAYLLPVGALAALAAGTVLERRWRPTESLVTSLALQSAVAALVFCTVAAVDQHLTPPTTAGFWLAIGWLVVLSTLGGYGTYLFVVRRSGATRASTLLYLTPPTTAVWAWLLFGQAPSRLAVPGSLICAAGVGLALCKLPAAPPTRCGSALHRRHRGREQRCILLVGQGQRDRAQSPAVRGAYGDIVVEADNQPAGRSAGRDLGGSPMLDADMGPDGRSIPVNGDPMVGDRMMGRRPTGECLPRPLTPGVPADRRGRRAE